MADFPALTPNDRSYDLGLVPVEEYRGDSNAPVLFRSGTIAVGQKLTLPYLNRSRSEVEQIWDHFTGQQGETFALPAAVWCGHTGGSAMADSGLVWRYAERPEPERVSAGIYSLTVVLEAVGVNIAAASSGSALGTSDAGTIAVVEAPTLPARPEPVPDPSPEAPDITDVAPAGLELPACVLTFGDGVELRFGSQGLLDVAQLTFGDEVTLEYTPA